MERMDTLTRFGDLCTTVSIQSEAAGCPCQKLDSKGVEMGHGM